MTPYTSAYTERQVLREIGYAILMRVNNSRGGTRTPDPLINSRVPERLEYMSEGVRGATFGGETPNRYTEGHVAADVSAYTPTREVPAS